MTARAIGAARADEAVVTYTLKPEDEGKVIQCQVTGNNAVGDRDRRQRGRRRAVARALPAAAAARGRRCRARCSRGNRNARRARSQDAEEGKLLPLFIQARDPSAGVIVKLHGKTTANRTTGQLTSVFEDQPQQPFELFQLKLKGGPRAPLANPQSCGPATTTADLTPWSAPGLGGPSGTEPIAGTPDAHSVLVV